MTPNYKILQIQKKKDKKILQLKLYNTIYNIFLTFQIQPQLTAED